MHTNEMSSSIEIMSDSGILLRVCQASDWLPAIIHMRLFDTTLVVKMHGLAGAR
jgi:hypothetical protein